MEENKDSEIARLKEQIETKSSLLEAINKMAAYREKEVDDLKSEIQHLKGVLKEAEDLRNELKSLQEKFNALKYYGRDVEMDSLKREVNHLRDYIDECYKYIGYKDKIKLEDDYFHLIINHRYKI
jgi:chromosome segregation ATPase